VKGKVGGDGPAPKCLTASRLLRLPRRRMVFVPVGARRASWSRVRTSPPAAKMRAFAVAVKRSAAIESLGNVSRRMSSVTVPTTTMTFDSSSPAAEVSVVILERETGGRFVFDRKRRRRMVYHGSI
jgi:hypothetical protein